MFVQCAFPARVAGGFFGPLIEVADDAVLVKQTKQSALYRALENQFNELADFHMSRVVAGELVEADPADGCSPHVGGSAAVRGKVVLAIRGGACVGAFMYLFQLCKHLSACVDIV